MNHYEYTVLPEYSPLYPKLPYHYKNYKKISAFCRGNKEAMAKFLPLEFEPHSDIFEAFVLKNDKIEGLEPYAEGGIVIPCKYKDRIGAHMAFEYVNTDDALCAGREIWGYPKKLAEVDFIDQGGKVLGRVARKGKTIINIEFEASDKAFEIPYMFPRLQVKRMPHPEVYKTDVNWVVLNEFSDSVVHIRRMGEARLSWEYSEDDPLAELGPVEVVGGLYVDGDFTLTYGKVIEKLENSLERRTDEK